MANIDDFPSFYPRPGYEGEVYYEIPWRGDEDDVYDEYFERRTLQDWNAIGYRIKKGEKALHMPGLNVPIFGEWQVVPTPIHTGQALEVFEVFEDALEWAKKYPGWEIKRAEDENFDYEFVGVIPVVSGYYDSCADEMNKEDDEERPSIELMSSDYDEWDDHMYSECAYTTMDDFPRYTRT